MKVEQIYTECLAQGAYYVHDGAEAAVIDPLREVDVYIKKAEEDGVVIKYIFETHFHADFVSGHVSLADRTGAQIVFGPDATPSYQAHIATDGEQFAIGKSSITAIHTPGHTLESTSFLLRNEEGKEEAIFSGDTLFLGDVGRPDLAQKAAHLTQEELAGMLFDSLRNKIMPLGDDLLVYPAHGAGSACGKNMMTETVDTLGNQKKVNYALRADMTKEEFIKEVLNGLLPPPGYFPMNVKLNKEGYSASEDLLSAHDNAIEVADFEKFMTDNEVTILDVRSQEEFINGHIPGSIFIGLDGSFAPWVGQIIADISRPLALVCPLGREEEALTRLARVGFDQVKGHLKGGWQSWVAAQKTQEGLNSISPEAFASVHKETSQTVFDVRKPGEYEANHLEGAVSIPLANIAELMDSFPKDGAFYIHCKGGYRSVIASSILKASGQNRVINVEGGFDALESQGLVLETQTCKNA